MKRLNITIITGAAIAVIVANASCAQELSFNGETRPAAAIRALLAANTPWIPMPEPSKPVADKSLIETQAQHLSPEAVDRKLEEISRVISTLSTRKLDILLQLAGTINPELRASLTKQQAGIEELLAAAQKDYWKLSSLGYLAVDIPSQAQFNTMLARLPELNAEKAGIELRMTELETACAAEKDPAVNTQLLKSYQVLALRLAEVNKQIREINSWK